MTDSGALSGAELKRLERLYPHAPKACITMAGALISILHTEPRLHALMALRRAIDADPDGLALGVIDFYHEALAMLSEGLRVPEGELHKRICVKLIAEAPDDYAE